MKFVRRAIHSGFVWLTVVTTLIAGVPHFDCVCPNGDHKPFCLGLRSSRAGCCCGGACCPSSSGGPCCCQNSDPAGGTEGGCCGSPSQGTEEASSRESTDQSTSGARAGSSCCKKTFVEAQSVVVPPAKSNVEHDLMEGFSVPLPPLASPVPPAGRAFFCRPSQQLPPPTDLVITLQHFVI